MTSSLKLTGLAFFCIAVAACGSSDKDAKFAYVERPVELLYAEAAESLERRRFDTAIALFEEVERQHPYSAWARRAMLMKAFAHYEGNDYEDALTSLDQFIALHPGNKDAPYAYYLKAMCYYERIRDVGRDQDFTEKAVAALTDVVRRYPDTEYARDARLKLDLTFDHLAGKEMYVGRFYLKENKHIAAINRFKTVLTRYQTTSHAAEALHRMVEAYLEIGVIPEARAAAAVLGHNYPGSRWYEDTYRLFEDFGLLAEANSVGASTQTAAILAPEATGAESGAPLIAQEN
ncbi:MAG: outer membrane protein assembly factor BamD [Pseudomonadota bacterium]